MTATPAAGPTTPKWPAPSCGCCTFDEQLETETGYTTNEAVPFKLRGDTFAPGNSGLEVLWLTKAEFAALKKRLADSGEPDFFGNPGTGDKLRLVENPSPLTKAIQVDIDGTNNGMIVEAEIEGDNDADLAAIGASGSGAAGQVVTLNLGLNNLGPATLAFLGGGAGTFDVTLPPGSSLAEMPGTCLAMKQIGDDPKEDPDPNNLLTRIIRCGNESLLFKAGSEWTVPVKLRIGQVITGATGTVTVARCDGCHKDKNPANDTANVVLNPALPTTGVQTGLLAGIGALLALAGIAAFVLGRHRTFRFTA